MFKFVNTSNVIKQTTFTITLKPRKNLQARLNIIKMHQMFVSDHPDLEIEVKYNFYYKYFKEHFDYDIRDPQIDVCIKCESLITKVKSSIMSSIMSKCYTECHYWTDSAQMEGQEILQWTERKTKHNKGYWKNSCIVCRLHVKISLFTYTCAIKILNTSNLGKIFFIPYMKTNSAKIYMYHENQADTSQDELYPFLFCYIYYYVASTAHNLLLFSDGVERKTKNTHWYHLSSFCVVQHILNSPHIIFQYMVRHSCNAIVVIAYVKQLLRQTDHVYMPQ